MAATIMMNCCHCQRSASSVFKSMRFVDFFHAFLCTFSCVFVINRNAFCGQLMRFRRTDTWIDLHWSKRVSQGEFDCKVRYDYETYHTRIISVRYVRTL